MQLPDADQSTYWKTARVDAAAIRERWPVTLLGQLVVMAASIATIVFSDASLALKILLGAVAWLAAGGFELGFWCIAPRRQRQWMAGELERVRTQASSDVQTAHQSEQLARMAQEAAERRAQTAQHDANARASTIGSELYMTSQRRRTLLQGIEVLARGPEGSHDDPALWRDHARQMLESQGVAADLARFDAASDDDRRTDVIRELSGRVSHWVEAFGSEIEPHIADVS
jgi:hypothetical protein